MTREEAINIISQMIKDEEGFLSDNTVEAHKMAIKALEQEPCDTCGYEEGSIYCKEHCPHEAKIEQEPCEDAISREDALMCLTGEIKETDTIETIIARFARRIRKLPPVNPTKTGHWEQYGNSWEDKFKCSECGKEQPKILCGEQIIGHWSDYCPNCGCRMVEPQERSDNE